MQVKTINTHNNQSCKKSRVLYKTEGILKRFGLTMRTKHTNKM